MRFPGYVPDAVQNYITALIDGDGSYKGWAVVTNEPGLEWLVPVVAFLRRFETQDEVIRECFQYLAQEKFSDADKKRFVNAAWVALASDYPQYRQHLKNAEKQREEIAKKAAELATLIREISRHGLSDLPMEFDDVRTLLRETDGTDPIWPIMRRHLLGEPMEPPSENAATDDEVEVIVCREVEIKIGTAQKLAPVAQLREDIGYTWGIAPGLPELLDTVARAARNYEPQFYGRIGAAIEKRQNNDKTQYLRAFRHELDGFDMTLPILNAMACMATVALNDPNVVVSCDDVKQALDLK